MGIVTEERYGHLCVEEGEEGEEEEGGEEAEEAEEEEEEEEEMGGIHGDVVEREKGDTYL